MIKTLKHLRLNVMLMMLMFLLLKTVDAQPLVFSSDQWPKRWGRAMNKPDMSEFFSQQRERQRDYRRNYQRKSQRKNSGAMKTSHQGWGQQQPEEFRNKRSQMPDYRNNYYQRDESDYLKRRYAVPESMPYSSGYGAYPLNYYYGASPYSYAPAYGGLYPYSYQGIYPGIGVPGLGLGIPGLGVPGLGFPYSSPFLMAPGITPGMGYPW